MEAGRRHDLLLGRESPSGYRESGQQEEEKEVGRLTGLSTATVSGFLLGSPTGTSGNTGLKVSEGSRRRRGCASALMWARPMGNSFSLQRFYLTGARDSPRRAGWGITASTAASLVGRHQRGGAGTARQAGATRLGGECPGTRKK